MILGFEELVGVRGESRSGGFVRCIVMGLALTADSVFQSQQQQWCTSTTV